MHRLSKEFWQDAVSEIHLHLVSDATGETAHAVARACIVQFEGVSPVEHNWPFVRSLEHVNKILGRIAEAPGPVLFTIVQEDLRLALEAGCSRLGVPCFPVLDPVVQGLAEHIGTGIRGVAGQQHELNREYFERMEAMNFTLSHDDGHSVEDLGDADVILIGVSRSSKTPTCIYLANRGLRAANIPFVPDVPLPPELEAVDKPGGPLIIGLTNDPRRLVKIRRDRFKMEEGEPDTDYVDPRLIREEVTAACRIFEQRRYPIIDVSVRSIEETAASVIEMLTDRDRKES